MSTERRDSPMGHGCDLHHENDACRHRYEESESLLPRANVDANTNSSKPPSLLLLAAPALIAGIIVRSFDLSFMATSYVRIASDLQNYKDASWILFITSICSAVFAPVYSYLLKSFGNRRMLLSANAIFAIGLVFCALSVSFWQLLSSRFVLGLGSAGITLLAKIIANEVVGVDNIAIWESFATCVAMAVSMTAGPLGAWLFRRFTWHIVFYLEAAFTILSLGVVYFCFAKIGSYEQYRRSTIVQKGTSKLPRLDIAGWFLLVPAVTVPLVAITLGDNILSWKSPVEIALLAFGPLLIGAFIWFELKVARTPIINMTPIFEPKYLQVLFQLVGVIFILNAIAYTIPPYIQVRAITRSSFEDWALSCVFFGLPVGAFAGGYLVKSQKVPVQRAMLVDSLILQLLTILFVSRVITPELAQSAAFLAAFGMSSGFYQSCLLYATLKITIKEWWPQALALYFLVETFGGDLGMALMAAVTRSLAKSGIRSSLGESATTEKIIADAMQDLDSIKRLDRDTAPLVQAAFENAMHTVFFLPCAMAALLVLVATVANLRSQPLHRS